MTRTMRSAWVALGAGAAGLLGMFAIGPALNRAGPDDDDNEPSECLVDATLRISANPAQVELGQSTVIRWSVSLPAGCGDVRIFLNGASVAATGSLTTSPPAPTVFTLVALARRPGANQRRTASATVQVVYPPRVVIDPSTPSPVEVLLGALQSTNAQQVIELCDVDLDLTGHIDIIIGDGRSLIASPACARGPRSLGPRIFVTDHRGNDPLFHIGGDQVLISGFRLEGPTSGIASGDFKEEGIQITPFPLATPIHDIEISNMEIFHWAGVGVQVNDNVELAERGRLFNTRVGAVRIVDSFLHHNRHTQEGYGVESHTGAYALFARNVFDQNRHAIAGGSKNDNGNGKDFSGYTARENLILAGGGLACGDGHLSGILAPATAFLRFCWHTHQIDMHGDDHTLGQDSNCGIAGETIIIERNTVIYTRGRSIKIRGNPADKAVVDGNVFLRSRGEAIRQNGTCGFGDNISNPIDVRPNNAFGVANPFAELGKCDFFGDGQLDDFLATGVTWWARSPVTGQWRYLNTMPERLGQLSLEHVDGDAICDVALKHPPNVAPRFYSKSGTGPWVAVQVVKG